MTKLTDKEIILMTAIVNDDFYEDGYRSCIWVDVLTDGLFKSVRTAGGVLASLVKKEFIYVSEPDTGRSGNPTSLCIAPNGVKWMEANLNLDEEGFRIKGQSVYKTSKELTKDIHIIVTLKAFTGMVIGVFEADFIDDSVFVCTKSGVLEFDRVTLRQINAKNPKFANRIEL